MAGVAGRSGSKTGKMSEEQVLRYLNEAWDGEKLKDKAKRYPATSSQLSRIRNGDCWRKLYEQFMSSKNEQRGQV